jgi:DMSO/TMAO reductase YedYZ molybdopterin-dependent catalytic subunit
MARGHLFFIVVLLAAAAVAGLLAVAQTTKATPASAADPAITFRMKKLDRLEASLEQQLAQRPAAAQTAPAVVYQRAQAPAASAHQTDEDAEERESEHEDERDD